MKRAIIFYFLAQLASPAFAATLITVDQLKKEIVASQSERDTMIAGHLVTLELTERLSASNLAALEAQLPGPESRRALVMLADQATFLDPPAAEIPKDPAPNFAEQRNILSKTIEYVWVMQIRLPNLFAQRETIHFEDSQPGPRADTINSFNPAQPLHPVSRTSVPVLYRDRQEFVQIAGKEQPAATLTTSGLTSFGEFGPILSTVLIDLPQGKLTWSHWEQSSDKRVAVFGFSVPRTTSHYSVKFCCVGTRPFQQLAGYHGEITINPDDGAILRLTLMADLAKDEPMTKADLMVEYGPIELGGRTYFCPVRSVAISLAMYQAGFRAAKTVTDASPLHSEPDHLSELPKQTMLNEVVFDHYHLFQSESRVLTAENSTPIPAAGTTVTAPAASQISNTPAKETVASAAPATAELRVTSQQTPWLPATTPNEAKFSLRVTTRSVEVSVAAFDEKGRPVTDLKPEDFEITDGGRRQTIRSFSPAASAATAVPIAATTTRSTTEYSNQADTSAGSAGKASAENATIIFFDATSLEFFDLTNARQQVLKIIGKLSPSEPVGLYVRIGFGFRVLLEPSIDRAALTAALNAWNPDARDLARARDAETRNRQQLDSLRNPGAVLSTYASVGGFGGGPMIDSDPKLFNQGEEPTREALSVLIAVAAHMGAVPAHKNLVWIASDNVLADWSDQSASGDEGRMSPNSIGAFSIRTQEALNNAHVSLYAFDASQLETDATDASLQNAGVGLDASVQDQFPGFKAPPGGRSMTQMRTQTHTVQVAVQQLAESTGGRSFGRSSNVIANLNRVIEDSRAIYSLSFAPDMQPDDKYHQLKVSVPNRRGVKLRYRTGYLYSKEPTTLKERFAQVLWQPFDSNGISITARRSPASGGAAVTLNIAAEDVALEQRGDRWIGKLDVFLVQRDDTGAGAQVKEQTLALDLLSATREKFMREGIPFEQYLDSKQNATGVRLIVVDEISGRMGSITLRAAAQETKH